MKKKRILLVSIILIPGLIYFLFELTQANFKKMAYYGPKTLNSKGDTVYYSVPEITFYNNVQFHSQPDASKADIEDRTIAKIDTINYPVYLILFIDNKLKDEGYKLKAFYDYVQYKPEEFKNVSIFFISDYNTAFGKDNITSKELKGDFDSLKINLPNFHPLLVEGSKAKEDYFNKKPYYVFDYFAVLVDKHRHIRGYYDPNQNSEVKRLLQEYKHLKIKDEYANTLQKNEIEKK
ncbi:MAG TPA: hypothetical protein VF411_07770 [Bacteroidia bacterium]